MACSARHRLVPDAGLRDPGRLRHPRKATAHTKFLNFGSNLGALLVFLAHGAVLWKLGLLMGLGQVLGAQLGSRVAMRQGARIIKPLLVTVSIALAIRLLADPAHPLRVWISG